MLISVIAVGSIVLVGLAVAVGWVDAGAQGAAWRSIAHRRRELAEQARLLDEREKALAGRERELWAWETQLVAAVRSDGCPVCVLRRSRGERPAD